MATPRPEGSARPGRPPAHPDAQPAEPIEALAVDLTCPRCAGTLVLEGRSATRTPDRPSTAALAVVYCAPCRARYRVTIAMELVGGTAHAIQQARR